MEPAVAHFQTFFTALRSCRGDIANFKQMRTAVHDRSPPLSGKTKLIRVLRIWFVLRKHAHRSSRECPPSRPPYQHHLANRDSVPHKVSEFCPLSRPYRKRIGRNSSFSGLAASI